MKQIFTILAWIGVYLFSVSVARAETFHPIKTAEELQNALNIAQSNGEDDVIKLQGKTYLASGGAFTYKPTENHSLSIVGANYHSTTLSGGNTNQVLIIDTTELSSDDAADVTIKKMTIENGVGTAFGGGLGVTTFDADITVEDCRIQNNTVSPGNSGGAGLVSLASGNVTVRDSIFTENSADGTGGLRVNSQSGTITVANNIISDNESTNGITGTGGLSVEARNGDSLVTGNILDSNEAVGSVGGAIVVLNGTGSATLVNNVFSNNSSGAGANHLGGGGAAFALNGFGSLTATNNSFYGNSTQDSGNGAGVGNGGGIYMKMEVDSASAFLFNNIVFGNSADGNGDDIYADDDGNNTNHNNIGSPLVLSHNDFSDFYSFCQNTSGCAPDVTLVANLPGLDPLFADAASGDLHLTSGSPCIDQGDAAAQGLPATDFEGDARIIGSAPDIGADESHF